MAKANLTTMSVEALLKLRDDIGNALSRKAGHLQGQLATLTDGGWTMSVANKRGVSKMKGRKVAPKYRNPKNWSETWAGRGAMPRWMAAEIKKGKKREHFAIDRATAKARKGSGKKSPRKEKGKKDLESAPA